MIVHVYNLSTWKRKVDKEFKASFCYTVSLRPDTGGMGGRIGMGYRQSSLMLSENIRSVFPEKVMSESFERCGGGF